MPVKIPQVFIKRLRGLGPHFVRVTKQGKEPVDRGWTTSPMEAYDPKLQAWLREGGNYGVVGGFGLVIVDIDHEELKAVAREKLPPTFTVESPGSKGWHLYYIGSLERPIRLRDKDGENVGDVQGHGKMVVGPGCIHPNGGVYRIIDDRPLAQITREQLVEAFKDYVVPDREIENIEALAKMEKSSVDTDLNILQVVPLAGLKRHGDEYYGPHPVHGSKTGRNFWINPLKNCWHCFRHGTGGGPLLWLAVEERIIDCSEAGPGALRGDIFKRVLEKAKERGLIEDSKTTYKKVVETTKEVVRVCFAELSDGRLIEQAFDGEKTYFLVYNPKTGVVEKAESVEDGDVTYKPVESAELWHKTVLLPSDVEEYGSDEQLAKEIMEFLDRWHEPPDLTSRILDVHYCFLTYIQDLVPQLPYRRVLASWGKGKTAWVDALGGICYRAVMLAGSDTDKSVVRRMHLWRGTCLIDEADFGNSSVYSFIVKILNIGFDRRRGWYYRCDDDNPRWVLGYYVYGAKLLATRSRYKDVALESRCLTTIGRENTKPIPLFRMQKFEEEAQRLRNRLILWRFRNYYRVKEEAKRLEEPEIAEKLYDGADKVSSRVKQVILPLWLVMGEKMREQLVALAKTFDERLKAEDNEYMLELEVREAVAKLVEENPSLVNVVKVLNVLIMRGGQEEEFYSVPLSTLSREILKQRGYNEKDITVKEVTSVSKTLSKLFESRLGFSIKVGMARKREVLIPVEWVKVKKSMADLVDFFGEGEAHNKDVQKVHYVHYSLNELLKMFRQAYPETFNNVEFYHWFVDEHGLKPSEAEGLLKQLVERGEVFGSYEGVWRWT